MNKRSNQNKIVFSVLGNFGSSNIGNEASLLFCLDFIERRFSEHSTYVICQNPGDVKRKYRLQAIAIFQHSFYSRSLRLIDKLLLYIPGHIHNVVTACLSLRRTNIIVIPGTGFLDDYGIQPHKESLGILLWLCIARMYSIPILMSGVGAGPVTNRLNRFIIKYIGSLATYRSYRDTYSSLFLQSIGINTDRDPIIPDIVFGLSLSKKAPPNPPNVTKSNFTVGIGVMNYAGWNRDSHTGRRIYNEYIRKMSSFVADLLKANMSVVLLIGDPEHDDIAAKDIIKYIDDKYNAGDLNKLLEYRKIFDIYSLSQVISKCDLVIATRYHNVIASLAMNKPVISIGYSQKNKEVMELFGLGVYCQNIEELNIERLKKQLHNLMFEYDKVIDFISKKNLECQKKLDQHRDTIENIIYRINTN